METLLIWESAFILVLAVWGIDVGHGADNIAFICFFSLLFPTTVVCCPRKEKYEKYYCYFRDTVLYTFFKSLFYSGTCLLNGSGCWLPLGSSVLCVVSRVTAREFQGYTQISVFKRMLGGKCVILQFTAFKIIQSSFTDRIFMNAMYEIAGQWTSYQQIICL